MNDALVLLERLNHGNRAVPERVGSALPAIARVVEMLRPEDFYRDAHRRIYDTVVELFERGEPVDLITVTDRLRDKGQRRDGSYEAHKSRTYSVSLTKLYGAFATPARRRAWLPEPGIVVRKATAGKSMHLAWPDGSSVDFAFAAKAPGKSQVAIQHAKLPDRTAAARMKKYWEERLESLAGTFGAV